MNWTIFWKVFAVDISLATGIVSVSTAWVLPHSEAFKRWNKLAKIVSIAGLVIVTCLCLAIIIGIMKWNTLWSAAGIILFCQLIYSMY